MRAGDVSGNRKPEPASPLIHITRLIQPHKRLKDIFPSLCRNAWSVIVDTH